jgi:hypothetical protein
MGTAGLDGLAVDTLVAVDGVVQFVNNRLLSTDQIYNGINQLTFPPTNVIVDGNGCAVDSECQVGDPGAICETDVDGNNYCLPGAG